MAYGRSYSSRGGSKRRVTFRRSRSKKAVPARKPRATRAMAAYKRSRAINVNRSMIRSLKKQMQGPIQKNFQKMTRAVVPISSRPVAFDLTDFTCYNVAKEPPSTTTDGCRIYQYNNLGALASVSSWSKASMIDNPFWASMNQDIPDTGQYLPVRVDYTFKMEGIPSLDNTHVRFDVFSAKPQVYAAGSINNDTVMPVCLKHMTALAEGDQNRINSTFFRKYFTKHFFFNSHKVPATAANPTQGTTSNIKYCKFSIRPKKVRHQKVTNPIDPMDNRTESGVDASNYGYLNVPINEPLWVVISCTDVTTLPVPSTDFLSVTGSRMCVWRDELGGAALSS